MEFIVEDNKGKTYKINAQESYSIEHNPCLWCMVYKALGIGANPYDYGEMEYEEDYSADFCIHPEDCDIKDEEEVIDFVQDCFYDPDWIRNNIDSNYRCDDEEDCSDTPSAGIKYFEDWGRRLLEEYGILKIEMENMSVEGALSDMRHIASRMADFIEEFINSK